ncbi:hypothetical protein AMAG_00963 [Allomyces macrogynus ATCC 38327]|uniref:Uncharacterized protein n=1 Tax=Allomyces macrogynus (strain ATCC 38327) TaxID=578462 RepID=A0A0L0RY04_ALLM3|nr:hypothetical protein AMAG_00963 [Allomyces macrogynus ATCC 38327]|eukprot:KNE55025.1 hypothetical protein AMAG_00963 [Allomyces macrogynus ATCC 38327]
MKCPSLILATVAAVFAIAATADAQQVETSKNVPSFLKVSESIKHMGERVAHNSRNMKAKTVKSWTVAGSGPRKGHGPMVANTVKGGRPIKRTGSKPSARARKIAALSKQIKGLPANHPHRHMLEQQLKTIKSKKPKTKTAALMSTAAAPGAHRAPAGLVPFVDPPFPAAIQHGADGSVRLVRKGLTAGNGVIHKYGFQTAKPLSIPVGTKYVTFTAQIKAQAKKPVQRKTKPGTPPTCHKSDTAITVFHGGKPLGGLRFPKGSHGSDQYETLKLRVPVSKLSATLAPITLQAAHDHASTTKCMDHSILQIKGFKVQFHGSQPMRKPTTAAGTKAKFSVSESGYDYASFDDSWDETYDDMWEDNYEGDFSVSEDVTDEGDNDQWDDATGFLYSADVFSLESPRVDFNPEFGFATADDAEENDAEDAYDGEGFSISEDAAYDGDEMWEDMYEGDFSVEDAYNEDAADDEY